MADLPIKYNALAAFWRLFSWTAYNELTVPDNAGDKYISFEQSTGSLGDILYLTAHLWHCNATDWSILHAKAKEIEQKIGYDAYIMPIQGGRMIIKRGSPFSQDMRDGTEKRTLSILLNITVEYVTE